MKRIIRTRLLTPKEVARDKKIIKQVEKEFPKSKALWLEFIRKGLCGLCGNSGVVNTLGVRSAAGVECGVVSYCICPNGRASKRIAKKWKKD